MFFREIIAVYCENHMKHSNRTCGKNEAFLNVQKDGIYSYHCDLEGLKYDMTYLNYTMTTSFQIIIHHPTIQHYIV
jgi:hypothetical protein